LYRVGEIKLGKTLERAIKEVEEQGLEQDLKNRVIELWRDIEDNFTEERKPKG
jgi:hypothetical protein